MLVFLCYALLVVALHNLDFVFAEDKRVDGEIYENDSRNFVAV